MKTLILLFLLTLSACTTGSSPSSVVYDQTSVDACANLDAGVFRSKTLSAISEAFGGAGVTLCKNRTIVDEPVVIQNKNPNKKMSR